MIVGMGDDPSIGEYERLLLSMKTTARKELVLLHPDRSVTPGTTRLWLKVDFYLKKCGMLASDTSSRIGHGFISISMLNCRSVLLIEI